jgi:glutamate racemase
MSSSPIGIFDSGVGGLSVFKEIQQLLPHEQLYYVADSGFAPYGDKSCDYIVLRCTAIVEFFLAQGVKAIVVACNTATSVAVDALRAWCPVPIIAMEPAIKPAALHTKSGRVGVLATSQTIASANVHRLIAEHGKDIQVHLQACHGFVELVERGVCRGEQVSSLVEAYVNPLLEVGVDTLVLGCTHYPFLLPEIRQVAGDTVTIIDPSPAIARQLQRRLSERGLLNEWGDLLVVPKFWTSGNVATTQMVMMRLLGQALTLSVFDR